MSDLKVKEIEMEGKQLHVFMRNDWDSPQTLRLKVDLTKIKTKDEALSVIKDLIDDLYDLKHDIEYGHTFDELTGEQTKEGGDTF